MPDSDYPGKSAYRGEVAARYDEDRVGEPVWALEQAFVGEWVGTLPAGQRLLDVPAGTGRFLEFYHRQGLQATAMDVSADMVAEIHRRHPEFARLHQVSVGDAERLALADDAVDYLISWRFFHLIPGDVIDRVLGEFRRVCRGTVVVQVFAVTPPPWRRWWNGLRRRIAPPPSAAPAPTGDRPAEASPWAHIGNFPHTERSLRARFDQAGFTVTRAVTLPGGESLPNRVYFLQRRPARA